MGRTIKRYVDIANANNTDSSSEVASGGDKSRLILLHGNVTESSIQQVIVQLLQYADQSPKPINLVISTYGGEIYEMFSLYDVMKFLPCPVHTLALGKVMSAGVLLLAAGTKGKRFVGRSSKIMIHAMSGWLGGSVMDIVTTADEMAKEQEQLVQALLTETSMKESELRQMMKAGDNYVSPAQAVTYGIVDRIIGDRKLGE